MIKTCMLITCVCVCVCVCVCEMSIRNESSQAVLTCDHVWHLFNTVWFGHWGTLSVSCLPPWQLRQLVFCQMFIWSLNEYISVCIIYLYLQPIIAYVKFLLLLSVYLRVCVYMHKHTFELIFNNISSQIYTSAHVTVR